MMNLEEWLKSKLPAPVVESEKSEEVETEATEEVEELMPEEEEEEMTSRSKVLETNAFPRILAKILSYLDARSVKKASLVSR